MERYFHTEGRCNPKKHYMVNLDERLKQIRKFYIDREKYFVINRGRQYGKTTTLMALAEYLKNDYAALFLDFQKIGTEEFQNAFLFVRAFSKMLLEEFNRIDITNKEELLRPFISLIDDGNGSMGELFSRISTLYKNTKCPIVLIIDEVDNASNYQVFLDFLAMLRGGITSIGKTLQFFSLSFSPGYTISRIKN